MPEADQPSEGELILYRTPEGAVRVEVLYEGETFWLNQSRIAELFGVTVPTVSHHLSEIYNSGELRPEATLRRFPRVQREGAREVRREIEFYDLDAIISVGHRVSAQATQFRTAEVAEEEYEKLRVKQDRAFESDFEKEVKRESGREPKPERGGGP
jgi:hypothetical protein